MRWLQHAWTAFHCYMTPYTDDDGNITGHPTWPSAWLEAEHALPPPRRSPLCFLGLHRWEFEYDQRVDLPGFCALFPVYQCARPCCTARQMRAARQSA